LSQRTNPRQYEVQGAAQAGTEVRVNGTVATRQGEYFQFEGTAAVATAQWLDPTVTLNGATLISGRKKYVPPQTEAMLHDVAGNRTQDGRWEMRWDNENRLVDVWTLPAAATAGVPNQRLRYTYDADGRLIERRRFSWVSGEWSLAETTRYLNDGLQCVAEFNASNVLLRRQVWGLDLNGSRGGLGGIGGLLWIVSTANGTHYAAPDGSGNVVALFGTSGTETARYEYGPFGELLRMSGTPIAAENPWRFSSKRQDPTTDWVHYEFRVYDPSSGRWLSRDPIGEAGGENLYGFVGNDPVNQVDLFGFCATCPAEEPIESPVTRPPPGPIKRVAGWFGGVVSEAMDIGWELVKGALYGFDYDFDRNPYGEESWSRLGNRDGLYENYKDADGNTIRTSELILQVFCMAASAPLEGIGLADDLVRGASWLGRTSRAARTGAGIVKETCEFGKRVAKRSAKAVKKAAKRPLRAAKTALGVGEDGAKRIAKFDDGIPPTGIPRFDARAVDSPHFERFLRLVKEQGFRVRASTSFTEARAIPA
jgi:RHS repeat-associated protein